MVRFAPHRTFDRAQYIVTRDFGKLGFESVTDPHETRAEIIDSIVAGQIDRVVSVVEVFVTEWTSRDITDDIKEAVEQRLALAVAAE